MCAAVFIHLAQNLHGTFLVHSWRVACFGIFLQYVDTFAWLRHFVVGVLGRVNCFWILCSFQVCVKFSKHVFPSIIGTKTSYALVEFSFYFFSWTPWTWIMSQIFFIKNTHTYLEKSCMNVTMYLPPLIETCLIGPRTYDCTNYRDSLALYLDCW